MNELNTVVKLLNSIYSTINPYDVKYTVVDGQLVCDFTLIDGKKTPPIISISPFHTRILDNLINAKQYLPYINVKSGIFGVYNIIIIVDGEVLKPQNGAGITLNESGKEILEDFINKISKEVSFDTDNYTHPNPRITLLNSKVKSMSSVGPESYTFNFELNPSEVILTIDNTSVTVNISSIQDFIFNSQEAIDEEITLDFMVRAISNLVYRSVVDSDQESKEQIEFFNKMLIAGHDYTDGLFYEIFIRNEMFMSGLGPIQVNPYDSEGYNKYYIKKLWEYLSLK